MDMEDLKCRILVSMVRTVFLLGYEYCGEGCSLRLYAVINIMRKSFKLANVFDLSEKGVFLLGIVLFAFYSLGESFYSLGSLHK